MPIVKLEVPSLRPWSAAKPPPNSMFICTTGKPGRSATTSLMPFDSVARCRAGKLRPGKLAGIGGPALRSTVLATVVYLGSTAGIGGET